MSLLRTRTENIVQKTARENLDSFGIRMAYRETERQNQMLPTCSLVKWGVFDYLILRQIRMISSLTEQLKYKQIQ